MIERDDFIVNVPAGTTFTVQLRKLDDVGLPSQLRVQQFAPIPGTGGVTVTTAADGTIRLPTGPVPGRTRIRIDSPDRSYLGRYEVSILAGSVP